jgi:hypothetical protein
MPAEPHDYRLLANLKAALQAIAVSAGFYYNVDNAAVKLDAEQGVEEMIAPGGPRPCIFIRLREEQWEYFASGEVRYKVPVTIFWQHTPAPLADAVLGEPSPTQDEDRMRIYYRGVADIEKAIGADSGRNGLSVDTRITDRQWLDVDTQDVWAAVDVELQVYRQYGVTT